MVTVAAVPAVAVAVSPTNSGDEQVLSSNSSPVLQRTTSCATTPELVEENERLRKENVQLSNELSHLRGLFNNILSLMTSYKSEGRPLEFMPATNVVAQPEAVEEELEEEEEMSPRLFGVSIGVKRVRRDEGEEEEEERNHRESEEREPGGEVKSEPLDGNSDHQDSPWLELGN